MDKDSREALQVAKELTAKFIETRTVSPGNFAEIFPAVYAVVARAIAQSGQPGGTGEPGQSGEACADAGDGHAPGAAGVAGASPRREGGRKSAGRHAGERE